MSRLRRRRLCRAGLLGCTVLLLALAGWRSAGPDPASLSASAPPTSAHGSAATGEAVAPEMALAAHSSGRLLRVQPPAAGEPLTEVASARRTRHVRVAVEVEQGLPVDAARFAQRVFEILRDPRGWQAVDGVRFVAVSTGAADVTVTLASPALADRLCAPMLTRGSLSCWHAGRAVLNALRWLSGAATYRGDLENYRRYLVSHEVGHGLGHGHVSCPGPGRLAPVMVQQTKSLGGCRANPWPAASR